MIKVLTVFGTRPEAIKMAPLVKALEKDESIRSIVAVTAQHREMLDQVLDLFAIKPDYDLNIMKPNQTIGQITSGVLQGLEDVLADAQPDLVLVHGDTSTTFAAALAAFYKQIPVGHVEAGLRTYDKYSPYPEEMNRQLTGRIASLHFAPTRRNHDNLIAEGIREEDIFITGNTVIDALIQVADKPYQFEDPALKDIDFASHKIITVTCHRRENLGEYMENIFSALRDIVQKHSDVQIIYPIHMNPKVRHTADKIFAGVERVKLIEPLQYQPFVNLMKHSYLIVTDSGGMQEEAPSLAKPVLVVRKETERPEAVQAGTVKLAGVERESIFRMIQELITDQKAYEKMAFAVNPYGDGTACAQIVKAIKEKLLD